MIIGINGKIGSGKDALAEAIMSLDPRWSNRKYADKLKQICAILTGVRDQYTQRGKALFLPEWGMTVGEIQQKLGTEAIRNALNPNAWVIALMSDYDYWCDTPQKWIVTDVRFPNEADAIKQRGGILVRIDGFRGETTRNRGHISETALDTYEDWDYRFDNSNLDLDGLYMHAKGILAYLETERNMVKQLTILVDIDGVCADLHSKWIERYNADYNDTLTMSQVSRWDWHHDLKCGVKIYDYLQEPGFFAGLTVIKGAYAALCRLSRYATLVAVTNVPPCAVRDRADWIREHLPMIDHIVIASDKTCVRGDFIIDDAPHNLANHSAVRIIVDKPYNRDFKDVYMRVKGLQDAALAILTHPLTLRSAT